MRLHRGSDAGLVVFGCEQIIAPVFEHDGAGGLVLRMQGVDADQFALHVDPPEQFAHRGNLVGFSATTTLPR